MKDLFLDVTESVLKFLDSNLNSSLAKHEKRVNDFTTPLSKAGLDSMEEIAFETARPFLLYAAALFTNQALSFEK